jgi:hypothetical protein
VPLLISHPQSPFQGQRYSDPVELIDLFPTVLDLLPVSPADAAAPSAQAAAAACEKLVPDMHVCRPLQGKSLAPAVLGTPVGDPDAPSARYPHGSSSSSASAPAAKKKRKAKRVKLRGGITSTQPPRSISKVMPPLGRDLFAVTQSWRCVYKSELARLAVNGSRGDLRRGGFNPWFECARQDNRSPDMRSKQVCVMGYSLRYAAARYTIWLHWDRVKNVPQLSVPPFAQELYDHRGESLQNFTHLELANLAHRPEFAEVAQRYRAQALHFLQHRVQFRGSTSSPSEYI